MTRCNGILVADSLYPVGSFVRTIHIRVVEIFAHNALPIVATFTTVETHLIHYLHILFGSKHLRHSIYVSPTYVAIVRYLDLTLLTLLGCYQDNTIGSGRTIDGTRCGILQDVNTLDVGRVQVVDITCYTINNIKRSCVAVGTGTTDRNLKAITRLTGSRLNVNTRSLALQGAEHLCGIHLLNIITLYLNGRTGNELFLLDTITYNNDFIKSLVVSLHCDFETRLVTHSNFLFLVTDIGNYNSRTRLYVQGKVTIKICNGTITRVALFYYTCTDNRTFCIAHITGYFLCLLYSIYALTRRCRPCFSCITQA